MMDHETRAVGKRWTITGRSEVTTHAQTHLLVEECAVDDTERMGQLNGVWVKVVPNTQPTAGAKQRQRLQELGVIRTENKGVSRADRRKAAAIARRTKKRLKCLSLR